MYKVDMYKDIFFYYSGVFVLVVFFASDVDEGQK